MSQPEMKMSDENAKPKQEIPRFCVKYREMPKDGKTQTFHNFFTAIDEADAEKQFWRTPIWKPPIKRIEIVSIEKV